MTTTGVLTMHGFTNANIFSFSAFLSLILSMSFWWRDVISEGRVGLNRTILYIYNFNLAKTIYNLNTAKAIPSKDVEKALNKYRTKNIYSKIYADKRNLGYYLAGLFVKNRIIKERFYLFSAATPVVIVNMVQTRAKSTRSSNSVCTALVVWGLNPSSGLTTRKLTKIELDMIKFPQEISSLIVGLLLSDGWLVYASTNHKSPRLGFEQSYNQASYVWSVYLSLSPYCYSLPKYRIRSRFNLQLSSLTVTTRSLPILVEFYNKFYCNGKKVIPQDIYDLLTPIALAHLIMGDGTANSNGLMLCTESYTVVDVVRLMNVLMIRYRLNCTLHNAVNDKPRIYIKHKSVKDLEAIISSYIVPSMEYKFNKSWRDKNLSYIKDIKK